MSDDTSTMTAVNQQFRTMMESNLAQGKKAYEQYGAGVERFLTSMEDAGRLAWSGARDVNVRFMTFVDENARAGFEYAERLTKAKDFGEMTSSAKSLPQGTNCTQWPKMCSACLTI
jgi:hypothetical protein